MNGRRWAMVEAERIALAKRLRELPDEQWDAESRCPDWRVRDVLGHLVHMAESTMASMRRDLRQRAGRDRDRGFLLAGKELGSWPVPELCQRLETAAASRYSGMPGVALSEVVVHGDDMLKPLGLRMSLRPEVARGVLHQLRRVDRLAARWAFHGPSHRGVRLVATDVDWAAGSGPEVQGEALDLAGLLAQRPGLKGLAGPGVSLLPQRQIV